MMIYPVKVNSDYRAVRKNGTVSAGIEFSVKAEINYSNPIIMLSGTMQDFDGFEYAYIDWGDRKIPYFVMQKELMPGNIYRLYLHIDVLMYYAWIFNIMAGNGASYVIRSWATVSKSKLFQDPKINMANPGPAQQQIIKFPKNTLISWENPYFVLTVAGSYGVFSST